MGIDASTLIMVILAATTLLTTSGLAIGFVMVTRSNVSKLEAAFADLKTQSAGTPERLASIEVELRHFRADHADMKTGIDRIWKRMENGQKSGTT